MNYFKNHVSLAGNKLEWVNLIEYEINNNSTQKEEERIKFAGEHTWENNVNQIYKCIEQLTNQ